MPAYTPSGPFVDVPPGTTPPAGAPKIDAAFFNRLEAGVVASAIKGDLAVNVKDYGAVGNGVADDTAAVQAALDQGGTVVFPAGSYRCAALGMISGTTMVAAGSVTITHIATGGFAGNFPRAMLTNKVQPTYFAPDAVGRTVVSNLARDLTITGPFTFDAAGAAVWGLQFIACDRVRVVGATVLNATGGLDLRAVRDSYFGYDTFAAITDDGVSVTDQNFAGRGTSTRITFDHCLVRDSNTHNTGAGSGKNAFEMDDGPTFVDFIGCQAINNKGNGFDVHVHTTDYDLHSVRFIGCKSVNNAPLAGNTDPVVGFSVGQCPSGSLLSRISYIDCVSTGSPLAFARLPGAQTGIVTDVTISGGYWESLQAPSGRDPLTSSVLYVGKDFDRFRVIGATLAGARDGFGVYTYATGGDLTLSDVVIPDAYAPLFLGATGGSVELVNVTATPKAPITAASTVCAYITAATVTIDGLTLTVDAANYTAAALRLIGVARGRVSATIRNSGAVGTSVGVTSQDSGLLIVAGSIIAGFATGIFWAGATSVAAVSGTVFRGCTAKYNTTPAGLTEAGNVL